MKSKIRISSFPTSWFCSWQCNKESSWIFGFKAMVSRMNHYIPECFSRAHSHSLALVVCCSSCQLQWNLQTLASTCAFSGITYRCNWDNANNWLVSQIAVRAETVNVTAHRAGCNTLIIILLGLLRHRNSYKELLWCFNISLISLPGY